MKSSTFELGLTPAVTLSRRKGDLTPKVTRGKSEMCHINARRQGEEK